MINLLCASITTPSRAFSRNEREIRMWDALAEFAETDREALRLRYVDGLPTKEIAVKLEKTDGAIRVLLSRAVDKLQQKLGDVKRSRGLAPRLRVRRFLPGTQVASGVNSSTSSARPRLWPASRRAASASADLAVAA